MIDPLSLNDYATIASSLRAAITVEEVAPLVYDDSESKE